MKRFISILFMISLCFTAVFAQEVKAEDETQQTEVQENEDQDIISEDIESEDKDSLMDDEANSSDEPGYVYESNGAGDQSLKIGLMANFPLNFGKQMYVGGAAEIGYYRFLTNTVALGGDIIIAYNVSIGEKPLITVPITFGAMWQPYYKQFEFPITAGIGIASVSCQGMTYFPALTTKISAGAYYRINESWSAGINTSVYWIPQWFKDSSKNANGVFETAAITARYHF